MNDTKSARAVIRDMWRERVDGAETVDTGETAREIRDALLEDPVFCRAYAETFLLDTVTVIGHALFQADKRFIRDGNRLTTPTALREDIKREVARSFANWMAWVPAEKVKVALPEMTKEQLLAACGDERERAMTGFVTSEFYRLIAGKLAPGQRVKDRWTDDQLADLQRRINVKVSTKLNGIEWPAATAAD